jgi:hypothetical protein
MLVLQARGGRTVPHPTAEPDAGWLLGVLEDEGLAGV